MAPIPIRPITIDGRTGKPPAPAPTPTPRSTPTPAPGHNYGGIAQPAPPPPPPPAPTPAPGHNYGGITQPAPAPAPTPPVSTIPQAGGTLSMSGPPMSVDSGAGLFSSMPEGYVPFKRLVPPQRTPLDSGAGLFSPMQEGYVPPRPTAPMPEGYVPLSPMPEGYVPFSSEPFSSEPGSRDLDLFSRMPEGYVPFSSGHLFGVYKPPSSAMGGGGGAAAASGGGGTSPGGAAGDAGDGGGGGSVEEAVERAANDTDGILPSLVPDDAPMPVEESIALADLLDKIVVNMMPGDIFEIPAGLQRALAAHDPNGQFVRLFDRILRALGFEPLGDIGLFGFNTDYFVPMEYAWSDEAMLIMQSMEAPTRKLMERLLKALLGKALLEQRFAVALTPALAPAQPRAALAPAQPQAAELPVPPQAAEQPVPSPEPATV